MKHLTISLIAAAMGFATAAMLFAPGQARRNEAAQPATPVELGSSKSSSTAPAPIRASRGEPGTPPKDAASLAQETVEKLRGLRVVAGPKRTQSIRQIIHQLETLVDLGAPALPSIKTFLTKFEDVEYAPDSIRDEDAEDAVADRMERAQAIRGLVPGGRRLPRLEFTTPPSLRLGLVDVLKDIGGEAAEQILVEMLGASGRGVEVAYVARALQEMAPDEHRDAAIAATKELLLNLPKIDRPSRLDENARAYLYSVLDLFGDTTFASNAQSLLVTADGHIDKTALNYLTSTLKDQAVPALYQAYKDSRITNLTDKATLASQILSHAGASQQANDVFREIVNDESVPPWMRTLSIRGLAGGRTPIATAMPTDPAQLQARIDLLNGLPHLADEQMNRARLETVERLSNRLATASASGETGRTFRDRAGTANTRPSGAAETPPIP